MTCIDMEAQQLISLFVGLTKQLFKIIEFLISFFCTSIFYLIDVFWLHVVLTLEERLCSLAVTLCKRKIVHMLFVEGSERLILIV